MNCQVSPSPLPGIWVIETLAGSDKVDISLLLDLLEKFPQASDDLGRNARELVSFRILKNFLFRGAQSNSTSSSSPKVSFDPSDSCEVVLIQILRETPALNLKAAGPGMLKWDVQSFMAHKRSSLDNHALLQLEDAILTGNHSFLEPFKERSGLPFGNQPESGLLADDDNCNGIVDGFEGTDPNTCVGKGNGQLISPDPANNSHLLQSDLPNENLLLVKRKRSASAKNVRGKSCKDQITSNNCLENHTKHFKKNDIIQCEQIVGGNLPSSGANGQLEDKMVIIPNHSERERCNMVRNIHVGEIGLNGPSKADKNEHVSLKDLGGPYEFLPCEMQVTHCDTELPNDNSDCQPGLENGIKEAKGDKEGFCDPKCTEDLKKVEPRIKANVQNGNDSGHTHCTHTQYSSATSCRDLIVLEDICAKLVESSEVPQQSGPPGEADYEFTSSKWLIGHEEQVCCDAIAVPIENIDEEQGQNSDPVNAGDKQDFNELKTTGGYMDKFEKEPHRNVGEAEDVIISSDSDKYRDERFDIATKKNAFLSSQCTFSQADISTQINVCVKCNEGGELLVCSTNSCPLVIHESCSGSQASIEATGEFYCPFCAYSRAISKYMDAKKKMSLTREDLANFVRLESGKVLKRQPCRSDRVNEHHLEQDDGLHKSGELNNQDSAEHSNSHQVRRQLEYVKGLSSGDNHLSSGNAVDSTNGKPHPLNKDEKGRKNKGQMLKSNESENNVEIRSKKGGVCSSETRLPHECKSSRHTDPADAHERSEEVNENPGVSKYFIRVQKHKRQYAYHGIPQLRRKRLLWTTAEEEKLKEGMQILRGPHDRVFPWKKILDFGAGVFDKSRSTIDLKDKWRNLCRASPKS